MCVRGSKSDIHVVMRGQLSFHHVCPRDQTQVFQLSSNRLSLLNHLTAYNFLLRLLTGARERAQRLRVLGAHPRDLGLVPAPLSKGSPPPGTPVLGGLVPSSGFCTHDTQQMQSHKEINKNKFLKINKIQIGAKLK